MTRKMFVHLMMLMAAATATAAAMLRPGKALSHLQ